VVGVTIWILLETAMSANIAPAQPEEIAEMFFEKIVKGKRVYDSLGRDVAREVIETVMDWHHYDAMKIVLEHRVCDFFKKLSKPEDVLIATIIARYYGLKVDTETVFKSFKNPGLIPIPPICKQT
jgi:hypothetical protein